MMTPRGNGSSQASVMELSTSFDKGGLRLDNYLLESRQELNTITELVDLGERVDRNSRNWMLDQVDFIVETIGDDAQELSDEMRSNLLQLLLAIANLNEQIRSQTSFDF